MTSFGHVIDGRERESLDGSRFDSIDPWTREPWADVALGGAADAGLAVAAARRAFDEGPWPRMGFAERGALLHRLADLVEQHADELALADSRDMGKPVTDARDKDVPRAARNFRFFADHARLATSETYPSDTGHHAYARFEPAGVVSAIAPWNFPLMLETWKVAPALAWGNTVVLKPAEDSPASATILARLALEAGFPPGVLNVVHGYGPASAGEALTTDPRVDRITFTGESGTGRTITAAAARNLTPREPRTRRQGRQPGFRRRRPRQRRRLVDQSHLHQRRTGLPGGVAPFVERAVLEEFTARFVAAAEALVIGDPRDPATQVGPLASETHWRKVSGYLDDPGGKVLTGGRGDGWVIRPTIVTDVPAASPLQCQEVFGPVVTITAFDTEAEAVRSANASPFGLNAMVFTENLSRAHRVSAGLRAGTVWTNCFFVRDLRAPFGGMGDSGWGREGGNFSREFFTEPKAVVMAIREQQ